MNTTTVPNGEVASDNKPGKGNVEAICLHNSRSSSSTPSSTASERPSITTNTGRCEDKYTYTPIDPNTDSIRLLGIHDGQNYELKTYSIESCPPFVAVSYTWDDPDADGEFKAKHSSTSPFLPPPAASSGRLEPPLSNHEKLKIHIDGRVLGVKPNLRALLDAIASFQSTRPPAAAESPQTAQEQGQELHATERRKALRHRPSLHHATHFWIDAICIDQENVSERNHQVRMMKSVYSQATLVLVWLGRAPRQSDRVLAALKSGVSTGWIELDVVKDEYGALLWDPEGFQQRKQIIGLSDYNSEADLEFLLGRRYWGRLWIIQELMLARDILLMCGTRTVPWISFTTWVQDSRLKDYGYRGYSSFGDDSIGNSKGARLVERKALWGENAALNSGYTLDFLIESFHHHECMDVRDKVYGLLGLLSTKGSSGGNALKVNYAATPTQLFEDVIIAVRDSPRLQSPRARERFSKTLRKALALPPEPREDCRLWMPQPEPAHLSDPIVSPCFPDSPSSSKSAPTDDDTKDDRTLSH